jgi:hypothetical protein
MTKQSPLLSLEDAFADDALDQLREAIDAAYDALNARGSADTVTIKVKVLDLLSIAAEAEWGRLIDESLADESGATSEGAR